MPRPWEQGPALRIRLDGRTDLALTSPVLADGEGRPVPYTQVEVGLFASEDAAEPIHPTLGGWSTGKVAPGRFRVIFLARDLQLRLAPYGGQLVYLRWAARPEAVVQLPVRVEG
jgi:hypothetical protein